MGKQIISLIKVVCVCMQLLWQAGVQGAIVVYDEVFNDGYTCTVGN